jgi:excisionase family DNA binding protein
VSELMTIKTAAPKLHVSEITLRRLIRSRSIPYHKIGEKRYFFTESDIENYLRNCEVPAKSQAEAAQ